MHRKPRALVARAACSALAVLAVANPGSAQAAWQPLPDPSARHGHALVHDPVRHVTILHGGSSDAPWRDTWEWDGSTWRQVAVTSTPTPQLDVVFGGVFDPLRAQVVVFGTAAQLPAPLQVWGFDGANWFQHAAPTALPVDTVAMAYDSGRGRIVVNGHVPAQSAWRIWEWNGSTWQQGATLAAVWSADDAPMVYDPVRAVCVMRRGQETRVYDGVGWTVASYSNVSPWDNYTLTWDPRRQVVVLMGGRGTRSYADIWLWNGTTWALDATALPSARERHAACFDATNDTLLVVGGRHRPHYSSPLEIAPGTFTEVAGGWTRRDAQSPAPSERPALCHDPVRDRLVLFGGQAAAPTSLHFEWSPANAWLERSFAVVPPPRWRHRLVHDAARGEVVLFGGLAQNPLGDTWVFDGTAWQQRTSTSAPSARYEPAMTYDEGRQVVVLYGGRDGSGNLRDTWEWNGAAWQQRVASFPPAEERAVLAFDPRRQRSVLITSGAPGPITMWLWDGANWLSQVPPAVRPTLTARDLYYDRARSRLVLVGSGAGGAETWDESGSAWSLRATEPRVDRDGALAYDAARGRAVFCSGRTASGLAVADVWQFASASPAILAGYGQGCAGGLGEPALGGDGLPWLGDTVTLRVSPVAATAIAWINTGFSATSHQGTPLPFDLGPFGFPGCQVLAAPEVVVLAAGAPLPLRTTPIAVPNVAAFVGLEWFHQALVYDPASASLAASSGLLARCGIR